jgi:hypothetical protein
MDVDLRSYKYLFCKVCGEETQHVNDGITMNWKCAANHPWCPKCKTHQRSYKDMVTVVPPVDPMWSSGEQWCCSCAGARDDAKTTT